MAVLEDLAAQCSPGDRLPGIRQLMEAHGFSLATMTSAIDELERRGLLVRKHGRGVFVVAPKVAPSCLVLADPAFFFGISRSPFWTHLLQGIQAEASAAGGRTDLHFLSLQTDEHGEAIHGSTRLPRVLRQDLEENAFSGAIFIGVPPEVAAQLQAKGVKAVSYAGPATWELASDWDNLVRGLMNELAAQGAKEVRLWNTAYNRGGPSIEPAAKSAGLELLGAEVPPDLERSIRTWPSQVNSRIVMGFNQAMAEFADGGLPEAFFSLDDMHTHGLLCALSRLGVKPGKDVLVATHSIAGSPILIQWAPELIRAEFDAAAMGRLLARAARAVGQNQDPSALESATAKVKMTKSGVLFSASPRIIPMAA